MTTIVGYAVTPYLSDSFLSAIIIGYVIFFCFMVFSIIKRLVSEQLSPSISRPRSLYLSYNEIRCGSANLHGIQLLYQKSRIIILFFFGKLYNSIVSPYIVG